MNRKQRPKDDYFVCPHCGSDVPVDAACCRECGASDDSGWGGDDSASGGGSYDGYGEDTDFDYDEFISREFPEYGEPSRTRRRGRWFMGLVVAILCVAFLLFVLASW